MCRPADHPEFTYMAYILYIFIAVDLYLALGLSMCRPADLPTYPEYIYIGLPLIIYKQDDTFIYII